MASPASKRRNRKGGKLSKRVRLRNAKLRAWSKERRLEKKAREVAMALQNDVPETHTETGRWSSKRQNVSNLLRSSHR